MTGFPWLTTELVRRHLPLSEATVKGHLDQQRKNLNSTQPKITSELPPPSPDTTSESEYQMDDMNPQPEQPSMLKSHFLYAACAEVTGMVFSDQTGRFLTPSVSGNKDILILYDYDSNFIHAEAMKNRTGPEILAAYKRGHELLSSRGLRPQLQRLDNEASAALQQYLTAMEVDYQLVPPHVHRRNAAERAIRTFKNHFIAGLCSTDANFPLKLWDRLLPQALITLNLLRGSRINPQLSAWAQVHGPFDYNKTPLAPPGIRVLIHEKPSVRETWAPHAVNGWYLGPAPLHYRSYRVWVNETSAERISDTLVWFPTKVVMPTVSSADAAEAAARDLISALLHPSAASPLAPLGDSKTAALRELATIFGQITDSSTDHPDETPSASLNREPQQGDNATSSAITFAPNATLVEPVAVQPPGTLPRVETVPTKKAAATHLHARVRPVPLPRVAAEKAPTDPDGFTYIGRTGNSGRRRRMANKAPKAAPKTTAGTPKELPSSRTEVPVPLASNLRKNRYAALLSAPPETEVVTPEISPILRESPVNSPHNTRSRNKQGIVATVHTANLVIEDLVTTAANANRVFWSANAVVDPATGNVEEYAQLKLKPDGAEWIQSMANELGRLTKGVLPNMPTGTETMRFIAPSEMPKHKTATYLRIVTAEKPNKAESKRVRCTVGGDRISYEGPVSTPTADLTTVKCLLNSVVSTPGAKFMTIDISDFYLGTPLDGFEYMRIPVKFIPACIMQQYKLADLVHNDHVLVEICKGMYGLPQAGILANNQLRAHLLKSGYEQAPHTPGLFRHETKPIAFSLIVDDFGVKYVGKEHAEHLIETLQSLYKITIDWTGTKYCGLTLEWDYIARTVHMSMPGYVEKALARFQSPAPKRPQHSPHAWTAPNYGTAVQYTAAEDTSAPLDASGITRLQEIIGTLLFYARAVDSTMLVALGSLASAQSKGTQATAQAATQLLNYAATHPDASVCFRASQMGLHAHSDASYLSESEARSRIGGIFFLSDRSSDKAKPPDPDAPPPPFNGAVLVVSSILKAVMSSATEAETGGLFYNCKEATVLRQTLIDMGHPQPATPIQTDNACAAGIANDTVKQRRSKAMDMRFYWVKDRVANGDFIIHWRRGTDNLADYFTKHHSPAHHRLMRSRYIVDLHRPLAANAITTRLSRGCVDDFLDSTESTTYHPGYETTSLVATKTSQYHRRTRSNCPVTALLKTHQRVA